MYRVLFVWMAVISASCSFDTMNPAEIADLGPAPTSPDLSGSTNPAKICSADGWCWENPLPQGNSIVGIWGTAADNVWAVGAAGTILKWDRASSRNC